MGLRPGRAKGPWVGVSAASAASLPGTGMIGAGSGELDALAGFRDDFDTVKPFWEDMPVITSGDWEIDTVNEYLEGLAVNNQRDNYRVGMEGDIDHSIKITVAGGDSCGLSLSGNGYIMTLVRHNGELKASDFGTTSYKIEAVGADTMWLRITRTENDQVKFWYKVNDADEWTLYYTVTADLGNDVAGALDSAANSFILEVIFYDNVMPQRIRSSSALEVALTDEATIAVDANRGNIMRVTLGGNRTMGAPTNAKKGQMILFRIYQDGTGSRTITWNAIYRFSTALPSPTLSTGAGDLDYILFIYNETDTKWDCIGQVIGF